MSKLRRRMYKSALEETLAMSEHQAGDVVLIGPADDLRLVPSMGRSWAELEKERAERKWEVHTYVVGDTVHVYPLKGSMGLASSYGTFWGPFSFRNQYPKTEKRLRKSVIKMQKWCDKENAKEKRGRELFASLERKK